jgi:hypothetical protein
MNRGCERAVALAALKMSETPNRVKHLLNQSNSNGFFIAI